MYCKYPYGSAINNTSGTLTVKLVEPPRGLLKY